MARIRTIKPEFFTSEDITALSMPARLLYIALWCEADREGRLAWKPKTFKHRYFPADNVKIDALCAELVSGGLVALYGDGYAFIPSFRDHQHINPRESASKLPDPANFYRPESDASLTRHSRVSDTQVGREGKGKEGKGREGDESGGDAPPGLPSGADDPVVITLPLNDGTEHEITESVVQELAPLYPAVDAIQELRAMRGWLLGNAANRKTRTGIMRFVTTWLGRAQDRGGSPRNLGGAKTARNAEQWAQTEAAFLGLASGSVIEGEVLP